MGGAGQPDGSVDWVDDLPAVVVATGEDLALEKAPDAPDIESCEFSLSIAVGRPANRRP